VSLQKWRTSSPFRGLGGLTDADGNIAQHVEYIPYGEVFVEERNSQFSTNFLFNAKELDNETGLYYYGARYLDPTGAMWLSVDPLYEKNISATPYNYCLNNPVVMLDPDGNAPWVVIAAGLGGVVNAGFAIYNNWDEPFSLSKVGKVGSAFLGGAACGAVAACGGVFFEGSVVAGAGFGALGGAVGDVTEQGLNIAFDNQKEYDGVKTLKSIAVGGVVNGVATKFVNGVKSSATEDLSKALEQKIPSQSELEAEFKEAFNVPKNLLIKEIIHNGEKIMIIIRI